MAVFFWQFLFLTLSSIFRFFAEWAQTSCKLSGFKILDENHHKNNHHKIIIQKIPHSQNHHYLFDKLEWSFSFPSCPSCKECVAQGDVDLASRAGSKIFTFGSYRPPGVTKWCWIENEPILPGVVFGCWGVKVCIHTLFLYVFVVWIERKGRLFGINGL